MERYALRGDEVLSFNVLKKSILSYSGNIMTKQVRSL